MAATGEHMAKPPMLTPDCRRLACQYVNILPILRERLANIQDQYLQSLKSIFLETLTWARATPCSNVLKVKLSQEGLEGADIGAVQTAVSPTRFGRTERGVTQCANV